MNGTGMVILLPVTYFFLAIGRYSPAKVPEVDMGKLVIHTIIHMSNFSLG